MQVFILQEIMFIIFNTCRWAGVSELQRRLVMDRASLAMRRTVSKPWFYFTIEVNAFDRRALEGDVKLLV